MASTLKTAPRWRRWEFGQEPGPNTASPQPQSWRTSPTPEEAPGQEQDGYSGKREVSTAGGLFIALFAGGALWFLLIRAMEWLGPALFH